MEQYAGCRLYRCLSSKFLGLAKPAVEHLTDDFVGLRAASTSRANPSLDNREVAALRVRYGMALTGPTLQNSFADTCGRPRSSTPSRVRS